MDIPGFVELDHVSLGDRPSAGGKAVSLGAVLRAGLPSPGGFCVTTDAFFRWLEGAPRSADIRGAYWRSADSPQETAADVRALLETVSVPSSVVDGLALQLRRIWKPGTLEGPLAVRSSGVAEDAGSHSFAGLFSTHLGAVTMAAVVEQVRDVWLSCFGAAAIAYWRRWALTPSAFGMAVIVQPLVDARAAGVLFTADPVTGDRDRITIEAVLGLGVPVVSGATRPDSFIVAKKTGAVLLTKRGFQPTMLAWDVHSREVLPRDLCEPDRSPPVLNKAAIAQLSSLAREVERLFGVPQDIEWALAPGGFQILQARPMAWRKK